jgi:hypothetical protein
MEVWQPMISAALRARRDELVDFCMDLTRINVDAPAESMDVSRRDIEQMIDGYIAVICEGAEERAPTTREFFLATVIPGLYAGGMSVAQLERGVVAWDVYAAAIVVQDLPAEHRSAAAKWFAMFFGTWNRDIILRGVEKRSA